MLALLILAALFVFFIFVVLVGMRGFHRLGLGQFTSLSVKLLPLIVLFDIAVLITAFDEPLIAVCPVAAHAVAFFLGVAARRNEPPPAPPGPPAGPPTTF